MIELLKKQLKDSMSVEDKINYTREFLQVLILKILYDKGFFKNMAFVGGTALRLLYDLKRFSEDIDFSLIKKKGYDFHRFIDSVKYELGHYNLDIELKNRTIKTVQSSMIKFKDVLYALDISRHKTEKINVKLEIDTNPPKSYNTELSLINKYYVFSVTHFDIPSLYATKLHACFFREYLKGRDFYDFIWYLGKKIFPNFKLLNNAIEQTQGKKMGIDERNFKNFLLEQVSKKDLKKAAKDVERFLIDKNELRLFDNALIQKYIQENIP